MTTPLDSTVERAAAGELPEWAVVGEARRAHMERVAGLLEGWAEGLGLDRDERTRWRSVGYLHDALRDADPATLAVRVPPDLRALPPKVLHGPAAAERLRIDGVLDGELLLSVAFHTTGHPGFRRLGRALYAADFLEPGRRGFPARTEEWRNRMPGDLDGVLRELLAARLTHLVERGLRLLPQTVDFWNVLAGGD